MRSGRLITALVFVAILFTLTSCSSDSKDDDSASGSTNGDGSPAAPGAPLIGKPTSDEFVPLIISALNAPIPVKGADDKYHVAYELLVLNAAPRLARITQVQTVTLDGKTLFTLAGEQIATQTLLVGDVPAAPQPVTEIPPGRAVYLLLDDVYPARADIPATFSHQISATFAAPGPEQAPAASTLFPSEVVARGADVGLGKGEPLRIGPPLKGPNWLAANSCCAPSSHRNAVVPVMGAPAARINGTERYAIDFILLDPAKMKDPSQIPGGIPFPSTDGDPATNEGYVAYGEPLLAVADATVIKVVDGAPDAIPQIATPGLTVQQLGGNYVILDLGDNYYAFYAHVINGSFTVREGQRVKKGDVLGKLGNSGNTSEAHLHFHISRAPTPLAGDQWPYVFDSFGVQGSLTLNDTGDGFFLDASAPRPGPRTDELPLSFDVVDFPG